MRTLAIDTATEACSIALFEDDRLLAHEHHVLGRGHAERLVPMIANLPDKGRAERILVSLGPGSFTGVRIGLAAARALGIAWGARVLGYPTLALVSTEARSRYPGKPASVAMRAGHGEIFIQNFNSTGLPESDLESLALEAAAQVAVHPIVAGTMAEEVQFARGHGIAAPMQPKARLALAVPERLLVTDLRPIYGRPPDAKPAKK